MANDKHLTETIVTTLQGMNSELVTIQAQLREIRSTQLDMYGTLRARPAVDPSAPIPVKLVAADVPIPVIAAEKALAVKVTEPIPLRVLIAEAEEALAKVDAAKEKEQKSEP